ncbi:hypothetical protein Tco_1415839, partial [Tanacetum coccineum]
MTTTVAVAGVAATPMIMFPLSLLVCVTIKTEECYAPFNSVGVDDLSNDSSVKVTDGVKLT